MYDAEDGTLVYDEIIGQPGTASGIASGAAVLDGTLVVGAGIGARSSGGSSPGDFTANTPSAIVALCVPDAPGCPQLPEYVAGTVEVMEGDAGSTVARIPVTLSFASSEQVKIQWQLIDVYPEVSGDIMAASGTVVFQPGQTEASVNLKIIGDLVDEEDELGVVELHSPVNAVPGDFDGRGYVLILDDDEGPPGC
jgi:hypothetical protein